MSSLWQVAKGMKRNNLYSLECRKRHSGQKLCTSDVCKGQQERKIVIHTNIKISALMIICRFRWWSLSSGGPPQIYSDIHTLQSHDHLEIRYEAIWRHKAQYFRPNQCNTCCMLCFALSINLVYESFLWNSLKLMNIMFVSNCHNLDALKNYLGLQSLARRSCHWDTKTGTIEKKKGLPEWGSFSKTWPGKHVDKTFHGAHSKKTIVLTEVHALDFSKTSQVFVICTHTKSVKRQQSRNLEVQSDQASSHNTDWGQACYCLKHRSFIRLYSCVVHRKYYHSNFGNISMWSFTRSHSLPRQQSKPVSFRWRLKNRIRKVCQCLPSSLCRVGGSWLTSRCMRQSPPVWTATTKIEPSIDTVIRNGVSLPRSSRLTTSPITPLLCSTHVMLRN